MYKFKNILITGAAGFIGCNFVRFLLNKYDDIRVISLDNLTYAGSTENLEDVMEYENHVFIQADIGNKEVIKKLLVDYDIDTIVNFAAESHVDNSISGPEVFFQTNVMGTFNLIEQATKYWQEKFSLHPEKCRFHHISTDEVYGTLLPEDPAFTENNKYEPSSPYSASKASSDHVVYCYGKTFALPFTISNCSNNYGPYQHKEKFIPVVIQSCLDKKPIPIYGNGSNIRDWLYVDDHCSAIDLILQKGIVGEAYNVGGDNELDNLSLAKNICTLLDKLKPIDRPYETLIQFVEDRKGHDWRYAIDSSKIKKSLGWNQNFDFVRAINETVKFYVKG